MTGLRELLTDRLFRREVYGRARSLAAVALVRLAWRAQWREAWREAGRLWGERR